MLSMMRRLPSDCVYTTMKSPVGKLWVIASQKGLHAILWEKDFAEKECKAMVAKIKQNNRHPIIKATGKQLKEYFLGQRKTFDIPLVFDGTSFQQKAWKQLTKIPYGQTLSYQQQAQKTGDAKRARAVGSANARNPISIVVPCHRVIAKSGDLSGFGGGQHNKKYLLDLERTTLCSSPSIS